MSSFNIIILSLICVEVPLLICLLIYKKCFSNKLKKKDVNKNDSDNQ